MRRAAILGALVVCACSSKSTTVDLADDARAGEVIAAVGEVEAVLHGESRPLVAGAVVYAGDELHTGAGAELRVALDHNGAVLTLGGDKKVALRASAAWRAEKAVAGALERGGTDETAAAGRHAERSAADTAATAATGGETRASDTEPAEVEAEADPKPAPGDLESQVRQAQEREKELEARRRAAEEKERALQEQMAAAKAEEEAARIRAELEAAKRKLEERDRVVERKRSGGGGKGGDDKRDGKIKVDCDPGDPLCGLGGESTRLSASEIAKVLRGLEVPLNECREKHGDGSVTVHVEVNDSGKPTSVKTSGATSPGLGECVTQVLRRAKFPRGGSFTQKLHLATQ